MNKYDHVVIGSGVGGLTTALILGKFGKKVALLEQHSNTAPLIRRFKRYSLLELKPTTGRRHQLRVHLYAIGHPIVGDVRYGDKTEQEKFPRLMLHAKGISCKLTGGKPVSIQVDLPESFSRFIESLE